MISVIVYGRNDSHGYNLHRRAALSLNCIAEVLTDPDDEIIFVDYNTPDELPTFVEALADTLTDRCLELLRVLRVPASLHTERFGARTHLAASEPVARNAAVRRANPSNRWLLSTNTDMILVPLLGESLSEVCGDLADGFYGLPRFELPEWVWERLPRANPERALAEVERLGPALHLDEPTLSDEWIRFDAPGDFQLVLRDDFFAIDGFDEEMLLGWHVDSNLSRRLLLHRGSIETLEGSIAGYHCNHSRIPTVYHGAEKVANDLDRFFVSVEGAALQAQRRTWGLADAALEEVPLRTDRPRVRGRLLATLPDRPGPRPPSDAVSVPFEMTYDSGHVLPFIADSLVVSPSTRRSATSGSTRSSSRCSRRLVERLGLPDTFGSRQARRPELGRRACAHCGPLRRRPRHRRVARGRLALAGRRTRARTATGEARAGPSALERLVELERARLELGEHPRRFVLVHSWTVFWDAYVLANLDCSHTTAHSRVRRGTVRRVPIDDEATRAAAGTRTPAHSAGPRGDVRENRASTFGPRRPSSWPT